MIIEYTSCKFSSIRWACKESLLSSSNDRYLLAASLDLQHGNDIRLYKIQSNQNDDSSQLTLVNSKHVGVSASNSLVSFGKDLFFSVYEDGSSTLFSVQEVAGDLKNSLVINEQRKWKTVDKFGLNSVSHCKPINATIAAGGNGSLHLFDIGSGAYKSTDKISNSSINCVDCLNRNEIICGNETGDLKLYDLRSGKVEQSLAQKLSALTCVRRHHSNGHIVSTGNDLGLLSIWDLRGTAENLQFIQAHDHPITNLEYHINEPNSLLTSSLDGQLLKWNFSTDNKFQDVHCVHGGRGETGVCCFDLSDFGKLAFFTDLQALNVMQL